MSLRWEAGRDAAVQGRVLQHPLGGPEVNAVGTDVGRKPNPSGRDGLLEGKLEYHCQYRLNLLCLTDWATGSRADPRGRQSDGWQRGRRACWSDWETETMGGLHRSTHVHLHFHGRMEGSLPSTHGIRSNCTGTGPTSRETESNAWARLACQGYGVLDISGSRLHDVISRPLRKGGQRA